MAVQSTLQLIQLPNRHRLQLSLSRLLSDLTTYYLKHRSRISRGIYLALFLALIHRLHNAVSEQKAASHHQADIRSRPGTGNVGQGQQKKRVEINREFFRNLFRLLKIVIPGIKSKELRLLISHSVFLVLRTMLSLYVAELDGKVVSSLVKGKGRDFLLGLIWWMMVAVPATFTNSMVRFLEKVKNRCFLPGANFSHEAAISPGQTVAALPGETHQPYPPEISFKHDILYLVGSGRSREECGSAHHRRRFPFLP